MDIMDMAGMAMAMVMAMAVIMKKKLRRVMYSKGSPVGLISEKDPANRGNHNLIR